MPTDGNSTVSALVNRRDFCRALPALTMLPALSADSAIALPLGQAELGLRITEMEVIGVRATTRTNWIFVRLTTNDGQTGLGEASVNRRLDLSELSGFFNLVRDRSPFEI